SDFSAILSDNGLEIVGRITDNYDTHKHSINYIQINENEPLERKILEEVELTFPFDWVESYYWLSMRDSMKVVWLNQSFESGRTFYLKAFNVETGEIDVLTSHVLIGHAYPDIFIAQAGEEIVAILNYDQYLLLLREGNNSSVENITLYNLSIIDYSASPALPYIFFLCQNQTDHGILQIYNVEDSTFLSSIPLEAICQRGSKVVFDPLSSNLYIYSQVSEYSSLILNASVTGNTISKFSTFDGPAIGRPSLIVLDGLPVLLDDYGGPDYYTNFLRIYQFDSNTKGWLETTLHVDYLIQRSASNIRVLRNKNDITEGFFFRTNNPESKEDDSRILWLVTPESLSFVFDPLIIKIEDPLSYLPLVLSFGGVLGVLVVSGVIGHKVRDKRMKRIQELNKLILPSATLEKEEEHQ
ncbi:MAG: hypothetical protein ACFFCQ_15115, partial [Promethearchaeota archaeon]